MTDFDLLQSMVTADEQRADAQSLSEGFEFTRQAQCLWSCTGYVLHRPRPRNRTRIPCIRGRHQPRVLDTRHSRSDTPFPPMVLRTWGRGSLLVGYAREEPVS